MQFIGFDRLPNKQYRYGKSQFVHVNSESGMLEYAPFAATNDTFPDFSTVGYKNSEQEIPVIENVLELFPSGLEDDTKRIQHALDMIGAMSMHQNGFRGSLFLHPGVYYIQGTLW